jgi:hypothetical protein
MKQQQQVHRRKNKKVNNRAHGKCKQQSMKQLYLHQEDIPSLSSKIEHMECAHQETTTSNNKQQQEAAKNT